MDIEKGIMLLLWIIVALTIVGFVVIIIVGYSTNFSFFFGLQDVTEYTKILAASKTNLIA